MQKEHTYTVDGLINGGGGLYPGGLISGWAYIRNNISSLANGWANTWGEGLKPGGALKWDFTVCLLLICAKTILSFLYKVSK